MNYQWNYKAPTQEETGSQGQSGVVPIAHQSWHNDG